MERFAHLEIVNEILSGRKVGQLPVAVLEAGYEVLIAGSFGYKNQRLPQVTRRNGGLLKIL